MSQSRTDRVWTGWRGLKLWTDLVPLWIEEEARAMDRWTTTFGGYVLAGPNLKDRDQFPQSFRPSAAS